MHHMPKEDIENFPLKWKLWIVKMIFITTSQWVSIFFSMNELKKREKKILIASLRQAASKLNCYYFLLLLSLIFITQFIFFLINAAFSSSCGEHFGYTTSSKWVWVVLCIYIYLEMRYFYKIKSTVDCCLKRFLMIMK